MKRALSGCAAACLIVGLLASCEDDSPSTPKPPEVVTETRLIRDVDYVKNKYFLIDSPTAFWGATKDHFDVFLQVTPADLIADPTILRFAGWAIPDSLGDGQAIWDAVAEIIAHESTSPRLEEDFRLLDPGADYSLIFDAYNDSTVVGLELTTAIPVFELRTLAIRYKSLAGVPIGGSYSTYGITAAIDTLLLEMIKPPDPRPTGSFASTWVLAMRNVYDLGWQDIPCTCSLTVVIEDVLTTTRPDPTLPEGSTVPYMRIFGLDTTDAAGTGPPDGRIDLSHIDLSRGLVRFPDLRAFAPDPSRVANWTGGAFEFTGPYQAQYDTSKRIYNGLLLNPTTENEVHQYLIKATLTRPAS